MIAIFPSCFVMLLFYENKQKGENARYGRKANPVTLTS